MTNDDDEPTLPHRRTHVVWRVLRWLLLAAAGAVVVGALFYWMIGGMQ